MLHHNWKTLQAALERQQLVQSRRLKTLREASLRATAAEQQLKAGGWLQAFSARHALSATQIAFGPTSNVCPAVQAQAHSLEQAAQRRAEGLNAALQEVTVQKLHWFRVENSLDPSAICPLQSSAALQTAAQTVACTVESSLPYQHAATSCPALQLAAQRTSVLAHQLPDTLRARQKHYCHTLEALAKQQRLRLWGLLEVLPLKLVPTRRGPAASLSASSNGGAEVLARAYVSICGLRLPDRPDVVPATQQEAQVFAHLAAEHSGKQQSRRPRRPASFSSD